MQSDFVRHTALDAHDELGIYAVSVFLALDDPVDVLCRHEPYLARYGKIRLSTAGRLRADGFVLIPTLGRPHYDIVLPDIGAVTLGHLDVDEPRRHGLVRPGRWIRRISLICDVSTEPSTLSLPWLLGSHAC